MLLGHIFQLQSRTIAILEQKSGDGQVVCFALDGQTILVAETIHLFGKIRKCSGKLVLIL